MLRVRRCLSTMSLEPTTARASELRENYEHISQQIKAAGPVQDVRLVAVSKLKPSSDILGLYNAGVRHFGENYPQELSDKAQELPREIQWHFIGHLQSNKTKLVASIPNLYAVETVSSIKVANLLEKALVSVERPDKLNIFIQINTSNEENKSGLAPPSTESDSEALTLARHILTECPHLTLKGLMTIGSFESSVAEGETNPDFEVLKESKTIMENRLGLDYPLELSMGMSNDFLQAVKQGSTNVRVGSSIFGARPPKK